jgi:hypothetical protein
MATDERWEGRLDAAVSALGTLDADPARIARIEARALAALARRRSYRTRSRTAEWCRAAEPALTCGLAVLYFVGSVLSSMAVYR